MKFDFTPDPKVLIALTHTPMQPLDALCELIDKNVTLQYGNASKAWNNNGLDEAVKLILAEGNTLFQSLTKNLKNHPALKDAIKGMLMEGTKITWNA